MSGPHGYDADARRQFGDDYNAQTAAHGAPTPEEQAVLDAALARMRAEAANASPPAPQGFTIAREDPAPPVTTPPPPPAAPEGRRETVDEKVDRLQAQRDAAEGEDFNAFWSAQGGGKKLRDVCGRDLQLPRSIPVRFEMEAERLKDNTDTASVIYLFDTLFGAGTWSDLIDRGIDAEQLPVLMVWGMANMAPGADMSLAQARAEHARMSAEKAAGKAPAPPSSLTGGATSGGSGA